PHAFARVERERAAVVLDDHRARDGEALAGAAADLLGGEEGVEDQRAYLLGNAAAVVADGDHDVFAVARGLDRDLAAPAAPAVLVGDGVRGVDDQVEHDLVDLSELARHGGNVAERQVDVRDALVLAAR